MTQQTLMMHKVRPFWGRVLVLDSPVDQEETESGIIVPVQAEHNPVLTRAVVTHHDAYYADQGETSQGYPYINLAPVGTVVWYLTERGRRIGDAVVVDADDIWAYEEA